MPVMQDIDPLFVSLLLGRSWTAPVLSNLSRSFRMALGDTPNLRATAFTDQLASKRDQLQWLYPAGTFGALQKPCEALSEHWFHAWPKPKWHTGTDQAQVSFLVTGLLSFNSQSLMHDKACGPVDFTHCPSDHTGHFWRVGISIKFLLLKIWGII